MSEIVVEVIVVIVVFTIFILNLLKVIKLFNKDNIVVKAKIISKTMTNVSYEVNNPFWSYGYTMEYKINDKTYEKKYEPYFNRKEHSYIKLIVNKMHGNIITTKLTRNVLAILLIVNSIFPIIMICSFFENILRFLSI